MYVGVAVFRCRPRVTVDPLFRRRGDCCINRVTFFRVTSRVTSRITFPSLMTITPVVSRIYQQQPYPFDQSSDLS